MITAPTNYEWEDGFKKTFEIEGWQLIGPSTLHTIRHKETGKKFLLATNGNSVSIVPFEEK